MGKGREDPRFIAERQRSKLASGRLPLGEAEGSHGSFSGETDSDPAIGLSLRDEMPGYLDWLEERLKNG